MDVTTITLLLKSIPVVIVSVSNVLYNIFLDKIFKIRPSILQFKFMFV